jgi:flagellar hook-associated protein 1 FlgK
VGAATVEREVDCFIESELRTSTADLSKSDALLTANGQLDRLLADPAGGLSPALQNFFGTLHDVTASPASIPARQVLLNDADGQVQRFHALAERLDDIRSGVDVPPRDVTTQVIALAVNLAAANEAVALERGSFSGQPPHDLLDQRDQLIKDLSVFLDLSTVEQDDGSLNVLIGSAQGLLVGSRAVELSSLPSEFGPTDTQVGFGVDAAVTEITDRLRGGALGGIIEFRSEVLGSTQSSLGKIAMGLARTVNEQHVAGQTLSDQQEGFFRGTRPNRVGRVPSINQCRCAAC